MSLNFEKNICIKASAGCGKTTSLVDLYLMFLEGKTAKGKLHPEEIVALTFTEMAAQEMKQRIREAIETKIKSFKTTDFAEINEYTKIWRQLFHANITTIHSFCARILRENPDFLGIDPNFRILTEGEAKYKLLKTIEDTLIRKLKEKDEAISWLIKYFDLRKTPGSHGTSLIEEFMKIIEKIRSLGREVEKELERGETDDNSTEKMKKVLKDIFFEYEKEKQRSSSLDFDDLLLLCRRLLLNKEIRRKYKEKFKVIMVDEFQDTNGIQRDIIFLLAEEKGKEEEILPEEKVEEKINLNRDSLFIVGDYKQSIYEFRGAEVEVFKSTIKKIENEQGVIKSLKKSYRFHKELVDFYNNFFKELFKDQGYSSDDDLEAEREDRYSSAIILNKIEKGGTIEEKREKDAEGIARKIVQMRGRIKITDKKSGEQRPLDFQDIAVLFRKLSDIKIYEKALRRYSVPYYVVKGRGFYGCQEIKDVLSFLKFIHNPLNKTSLVGILKSPFFSLSDESLYKLKKRYNLELNKVNNLEEFSEKDRKSIREAKDLIENLLPLSSNLKISEIIKIILEQTNIEAVLLSLYGGKQKYANLHKLWEIAGNFDHQGINLLIDFVTYLEMLVTRPPAEKEAEISLESEDAVKLMTVHQAKGLEFPVVILADLGGRFPNIKDDFLYSKRRGIAGKEIDENNFQKDKKENYKSIQRELKEVQSDEEDRILYVGMTRARDYLLLSGLSSQNRNDTWADKINKITKENYLNLTEEDFLDISVSPHQEKNDLKRLSAEDKDIILKNLRFSSSAKEVIISATSIANYLTCPRYYFLKNVVGIESIPQIEEESIEFKKSIFAGTLAHKVLELIDLKKRDLEEEIQLLINNYQNLGEVNLQDVELKEIKDALLRFLQSDLGKLLRGNGCILREVPFKLSINNNSYAILISGKIDCLIEKDNKIYLIDYKYAKEEDKINYQNQILIYTLALKKKVDKEISPLLVFLKDNKIKKIEIDEVKLSELKNKILNAFPHLLSLHQNVKTQYFASLPYYYLKDEKKEEYCLKQRCDFLGKYC